MKLNKISIISLVAVLFLIAGATAVSAQGKVRYIDSQRVLEEYPAAQEVQKKIRDLENAYKQEYSKLEQEAQQLYDEIQNQSLLLSPEKKAEKEGMLQQKMGDLQRYQVEKLGPQGEFFKKSQDLQKPLYENINQVIKKVAEDEGYDYILDSVGGVVLFAKPMFDITNVILEELNKSQ